MDNFSDYFTNPDYIKAHGLVKQCNENYGIIYIENEKDVSFWKEFFGSVVLNSYEITATNKGLSVGNATRGKARFEKLLESANKLAIFALDSDHDHLTPDRFEKCQHIINNPFVIHTYGYGKESYYNSIEVLNDCLEKYYFFKPSSFKFNKFLQDYSNIIYNSFIKTIHLLNHDSTFTDQSILSNNIIPQRNVLLDMYFEGDYKEFISSVQAYEQELDKILNDSDISNTTECCSNFGLNANNVYQFINGHDLENRIIHVIVNEIRCRLIKCEMDDFKKDGGKGTALRDRNNEINSHFDDCVNFKTIKHSCCNYKDNPLFINSLSQLSPLL
ncbi:DUF4435 domain-containing protein [Vibrio vulnificus]|nr:DUF4435 domain-containing protein [Vibrio vulnificus]EIA1286620.1 DUF4435 domain-containing protein [Vibrio vulnificus]